MPEFSVAIPVYNHAAYVEGAVLSALRSPLVREVLLVDDGSKDHSRDVIAAIARKYPQRVRDLTGQPGENRGAHVRLNQLVLAANCDWVAVLNSDDVFVRGRFEALAAHPRFPECEFAFGDLLLMDDQTTLVGVKRGPFDTGTPFPPVFNIPQMVESGDLIDLLGHQNFLGTTSNMIFTKALHRRIGGFAAYRYVHDWDFALRAMAVSPHIYVRRYFTAYRMHASNTIGEDPARVDSEVERLFHRLEADFPALFERPAFRVAVRENIHFVRLGKAFAARA